MAKKLCFSDIIRTTFVAIWSNLLYHYFTVIMQSLFKKSKKKENKNKRPGRVNLLKLPTNCMKFKSKPSRERTLATYSGKDALGIVRQFRDTSFKSSLKVSGFQLQQFLLVIL